MTMTMALVLGVVSDIDRVDRERRARDVPIAYDLIRAEVARQRAFLIRDVEGNLVQLFGR